ncbi:YciI family protein [Lactobacillus sp.]|uniref:YciI family protein n=1 Tax=Lactobacillus sp. TaxID=1591 RepID=UPI0019933FEC|nr:YciI family protein [Lactobacillus sp.]MBD5429215.1 hypothetical protein [Lactobacillus sp.]
MYILNIKIKENPVDKNKLAKHREWFKKYFDQGNFLIVGPYLDIETAGVIIAKANSKEQIEKIISEDVFYPNEAEYELHEFQANLVADKLD